MNSLDKLYLVALLNFTVCSAIGYICVCRFTVMSIDTKRVFRALYSALLVAATVSGLQPLLFREWPSAADAFVNIVLLAFVASGRNTWRGKPPAYACRDVECDDNVAEPAP